MTNLTALIIGLILGTLFVWIYFSIYMPKARTIQAIMFFGKLYTFIENIEGKKIYKDDGSTQWDIINLSPGEKKGLNIYFFLWPFFKVYTFSFTYTKEKMIGEEQEGDVVIWKDEKTGHCLVSRTGISDHLEWKAEYPTVTSSLDTEELATINTLTNNMLEVKNPAKVLFGIKNWFEATNEILYGGLRSLISIKKLHDINQYSSKDKDEFNKAMKDHANDDSLGHPGLPSIGLYLFTSVFKDFDPANELAKKLMESYTDVTIAEQTGEAKIITAEKEAKAYAIKQAAIIEWKKKYLIDTGLAETELDAKGNQIIKKLMPDANVRVGAEAIKELSKLTGTLVLDNGALNKMLSINPTNKKEEE